MKKYKLFLFVFVLFIILLGFNSYSANASNCASGDLFNTVTGKPCGTSVTAIGCSTGDLFSSVTGRRCSDNSNGNNGNHYGWCRALSNPGFKIGLRGDDVKKFQQGLKDDGLFFGKVDGVYGTLTERARLDNFRKCPIVSSDTPVINGVSGPQSLNVDQQGTWTVRAYNRGGGNLSYHVDWGEGSSNPSAGASLNSLTQQTATFTRSYPTAGTRTVTFEVTNSSGKTAQTTLTVNVSNTTQVLRVTSPNGEEGWKKGITKNITWTSPRYIRATYADIKLIEFIETCPTDVDCVQRTPFGYFVAQNINVNQNKYSWNVGNVLNYGPSGYGLTDQTIAPDGKYVIQICEKGTNNCDSSDSYFTISSSTITN